MRSSIGFMNEKTETGFTGYTFLTEKPFWCLAVNPYTINPRYGPKLEKKLKTTSKIFLYYVYVCVYMHEFVCLYVSLCIVDVVVVFVLVVVKSGLENAWYNIKTSNFLKSLQSQSISVNFSEFRIFAKAHCRGRQKALFPQGPIWRL